MEQGMNRLIKFIMGKTQILDRSFASAVHNGATTKIRCLILQDSKLLLFIIYTVFVTCCPSVQTLSSSKLDSKPLIDLHIGTMFCDASSFDTCIDAFNKSISSKKDNENNKINLISVNLYPVNSASFNIAYACDAIYNKNISIFVAVGSTEKINLLSLVTSHTRIPLLGYTTDKSKVAHKSERPYYVELNPSHSSIAESISKLLQYNLWNSTCLLIQTDYVLDSFEQTLRYLSKKGHWKIENSIQFDSMDTSDMIHHKIASMQENECTILIVHTDVSLAKNIFHMAKRYRLLGQGYAWLLTDSAYSTSKSTLGKYPTGTITFKLTKEGNKKTIVSTIGSQLKKSLISFSEKYGAIVEGLGGQKSCLSSSNFSSSDLKSPSSIFKRYLEKSSQYGRNGMKSQLSTRTVKILNLINDPNKNEQKVWKTVGTYKSGALKLSAVRWPGDTIVGPSHKGKRIIRVVTSIAPPFVMEQEAILGNCSYSLPCLRVKTKDKKELDDIFDDYANGRHFSPKSNVSYEVKCCQGFSISLLESLASDLNFAIQLYITVDNRYGSLVNGSWTGLVEDLTLGLAHMAVAPLSITKKRSKVIDFTHPYYYSGFAILVSEKKRQIPIYAFTEPFDQWIWISIVASATVVAVVLAVFEWNSPFGLNPWGRKRKTNYTLGSGLNMVYAILFGHTVKTKSPKAWPSKWLQNFWAGASIFIYSSYTANLAAFLAGKNSGVAVSGIYDTKLVAPGKSVGIIGGTAAEEYIQEVNQRLLVKARRLEPTLPIESAMALLMDDDIDAYIDDSPILQYARENMDASCKLHMVNNGFGEDAYGIGLPKHSWLKAMLNNQILKFHENGYIEEIRDRFFRRNRCSNMIEDELQGEADSMEFKQHAGLYLLLAVGIFMCVMLLLLEHATFKWLVPYWRRKQKSSFWKSLSMMFWSQRLYRIITSEELVSPHHSAREMIEVMKNRDFTKLFQKSVKKQEKLVRSRKNLFSVVEQLQWKQLRSETEMSNQSSMKSHKSDDDTECFVEDNMDKKLCGQKQNKYQKNNDKNSHENLGTSSKERNDEGKTDNRQYKYEHLAGRPHQSQSMQFEELENSDYLDEDDYLTYCFARNKASKSSGDCVIISQSQDLHVDLNYFVQK